MPIREVRHPFLILRIMNQYLIYIALAIVSFTLGKCCAPIPEIEEQKIETRIDTVFISSPAPIVETSDIYEELYFDLQKKTNKLIDSLSGDMAYLRDSISKIKPTIIYEEGEVVGVKIPLSDYRFTDSLNYDFTVNGYGVTMVGDVIVFNKTTTITNTIKPKTWFVNAGARAIVLNNQTNLYGSIGVYKRKDRWEYGFSYNKGLNGNDFYEINLSYNIFAK